MTQPTRAEAFLAAFAKTAGRRFDGAGRPILNSEEWTALAIAQHIDWSEAQERHAVTLRELARLDDLDRTVT